MAGKAPRCAPFLTAPPEDPVDTWSSSSGRSLQTTRKGEQETGRLGSGTERSQASGKQANRNNQTSLPHPARAGVNHRDDLKRRAEGGDSAAQFELAGLSEAQGESVVAFEWYKRSAEEGLPSAQFELGHCYLIGNGVEESRESEF